MYDMHLKRYDHHHHHNNKNGSEQSIYSLYVQCIQINQQIFLFSVLFDTMKFIYTQSLVVHRLSNQNAKYILVKLSALISSGLIDNCG